MSSVTTHLPMFDEAIAKSKTVLLMGHGGGSDCLVANLLTPWLHRNGVERVLVGGIACQWWPEPGTTGSDLLEVLGPDLYDPSHLDHVRPLGDHAVLVGPNSNLPHGRRPFESVYAEHFGREAFVISHRGGAVGAAAGLKAVVEYAKADMVISVDVGSDTLSTGGEVKPVQTAFADHLTTAALISQDVPCFFGLAGYGCDAEIELEELDANFGLIAAAGGIRGAVVPDHDAIEELDDLHRSRVDPVGSLVGRAFRGEFGLHRVLKDSPWGAVARLGPAAIPIWIMDPHVVVTEVAKHVLEIVGSRTIEEAETRYVELGRIPETRLARMIDYGRS